MPSLALIFPHVLVDVSSIAALCIRWFPKGNSNLFYTTPGILSVITGGIKLYQLTRTFFMKNSLFDVLLWISYRKILKILSFDPQNVKWSSLFYPHNFGKTQLLVHVIIVPPGNNRNYFFFLLNFCDLEKKMAPAKEKRHRAMDDIKESIKELKFYKENIFKLQKRNR